MAICNITDLKARLRPGHRLLGLDLGSKTIGMALSDPSFMIASPIGTIRRTKLPADMRELAKIAKERSVGGMVLGLPVNMDGSEGASAQSARQFAKSILQNAALFDPEPAIAFWDERLSTQAVERLMIGFDMTRKRRAEVVDKMASAYILQGALDLLARNAAPKFVHPADESEEESDDASSDQDAHVSASN